MILNNYSGGALKIAEANGRIVVRLGRINGICERAMCQLGSAEDAAAANRMLVKALQDVVDIVGQGQPKAEGGEK